jgi:hypothetical protein
MFELDQSEVFELNQEGEMECAQVRVSVNNADRRELLCRSQMLRGDNAESEGVGRLENANPLGRASNESSPLHRNYVNAPRSTPPRS